MENYNNILKDISYVRELRSVKVEDNDVLLTVLTIDNKDNVLSLDNLLSTNPELAENVINDTVTLILKDFGNVRDIEESIRILSEDVDGVRLLFRDERLEFEFIMLFGNENISIFDSETEREIATSEYNLDIARIVMMNIFLSNFRPDALSIFINNFIALEDYIYVDLATPILKSVDYNLIMDDFIAYFYGLEGFISEDNIVSLTKPFAESGWPGAVRFILDNTSDNVVISNDYNILSSMVSSNDSEMTAFICDEFIPRYVLDNDKSFVNLINIFIDQGTEEQFRFLSSILNGIDIARKEYLPDYTIFHIAMLNNTNIAKYMIFEYDIDPNEESLGESYIAISVKRNIEIFKLLISKDGLVLSKEDRELIENEAKYNEEIRAAYEEYLERNGFDNAINDFDLDEGHFTSM